MRSNVSYLPGKGKLNNASSATASGAAEGVTGLSLSTGVNSGDFLELTDAQALAASDTSVGTLFGGVYQRVKFTDATSIAIGTAVFWNRSDTSDPYAVTIVSSATQFNYAGTVIDASTVAGQYAWIQVNGRITALLASGAVGDQVNHPITAGGSYTAAAAAASSAVVGVQVSTVTSGVALVDVTRAQTRF